MTVEQALPVVAKILIKAQEEMKDKKQELELSILTESTQWRHKVLDRATVDTLTANALQEIENEEMETDWS